jgi:hypothetical protein
MSALLLMGSLWALTMWVCTRKGDDHDDNNSGAAPICPTLLSHET